MKVTIIGAGITGLTLAWRLKNAGCEVVLLEKNSHSGGVIQTVTEGDFVFETGPNTGVLNNNQIVDLFSSVADECKLSVARKEAKCRLILQGNRWEALPSGLFTAISTPLFSTADKFRLLGEPFRKKGENPNETLSELVERRMGKSFLRNAVDPFISGIYAGDPSKLVTRFAMPKLYNLEQTYGSFIGGSIKKAKADKAAGVEKRFGKEIFSADGGLQTLVDAIAKQVGTENIICNCQNVEASKSSNGFVVTYNVDNQHCNQTSDAVVLTTNAPQIPNIFSGLSDKLKRSISQLKYAPVMLVVVGYKRWTGMDLKSFGGLVPSAERRNVLGILFPSAIFNGRAPINGALLSVFMGGVRHPELLDKTDEDIKNIVLDEVFATLNEDAQPDLFHIYRHHQAIPQYDATMEQRLELIEQAENEIQGLYIAGNIQNGIGMGDRVKQAFDVADKIMAKNS